MAMTFVAQYDLNVPNTNLDFDYPIVAALAPPNTIIRAWRYRMYKCTTVAGKSIALLCIIFEIGLALVLVASASCYV